MAMQGIDPVHVPGAFCYIPPFNHFPTPNYNEYEKYTRALRTCASHSTRLSQMVLRFYETRTARHARYPGTYPDTV